MVDKLPIMETFYTLQGEGMYAGCAAYFIRLAGCDIGCHWCDVKESWDAQLYEEQSVDAIVKEIPPHVRLVVITGGEPTMYDLTELTQRLKERNIAVNLETSGAYSIKGVFDWICISPKKRKLPLEENLAMAHELKAIIHNQDDFSFAESFVQAVRSDCQLLLQVEWSKKEVLNDDIIAYVMRHPQWRLSVQTHKYLAIR